MFSKTVLCLFVHVAVAQVTLKSTANDSERENYSFLAYAFPSRRWSNSSSFFESAASAWIKLASKVLLRCMHLSSDISFQNVLVHGAHAEIIQRWGVQVGGCCRVGHRC